MTFTATRRFTGSNWSAIHTDPMPPSPICCNSLYFPAIILPVVSVCIADESICAGALADAGRRVWLIEKPARLVVGLEHRFDLGPQRGVADAFPV